MKKVLFVCYGAGHVRMVVPVARALVDGRRAQVQVLGLTTAATVVRDAGLPLLQVKDFLQPGDGPALETGRELAARMSPIVDKEESAAYLGLSYAELVASLGAAEAQARYARLGRQAFMPRRLLERIVRAVQPDLLVATNSPRAERAAVLAARALAIPAVCMVDLFAIDEVRWIGEVGYADRICVLNEHVRQFLLEVGRGPDEVVVTGNPAFDVLLTPESVRAGARLRESLGWNGRRVVLWAAQEEPAVHPFDGRPGDPGLPRRALDALLAWTARTPDAVLCVRARPGQVLPPISQDRVFMTGQDWALAPLLHAIDVVATLTSTVGLEGYLTGARLVQVTGSVFDAAMPLARFGIADAAVAVQELDSAVDRASLAGRRAPRTDRPAAGKILAVLDEFL